MKNLKKYILIYSLFIFVTLGINHTIFFNIVNKHDPSQVPINDNLILQTLYESTHKKLQTGESPFLLKNSILYPFDINYSLTDPGTANELYYGFFRLFFNPLKSLQSVVLLFVVLAMVFMYHAIRQLKISDSVAVLFAISYALTPFISHRIQGHYAYVAIYLFPFTFYVFAKALRANSRFFLIFAPSAVLAWDLYSNFYYFIAILLSIMALVMYVLLFERKKYMLHILNHYKEIILACLLFVLFISPIIIQAYQLNFFDEMAHAHGFNGAIQLSADVLNLFTPSEYNPIYSTLVSTVQDTSWVTHKAGIFFFNNWNRFAYPGVLPLFCMFLLFLYKKKFSKKSVQLIQPLLFASFFLLLFTFGPFLKVADHWRIVLEEGIYLVFPLPFLLLHKVPGLEGLRAPMRFTPAYVFFLSIASAIIVQTIAKKVNPTKKIVFISLLFCVIVLDQWYTIPAYHIQSIPLKLYTHIQKNPDKATVLEIPFTVRDGFIYKGFVHAINPMAGQLIHNKPIIGGYLPRVNGYIFDYYSKLSFIQYVFTITDQGNYNPIKELPQKNTIFPYPEDDSVAEIELRFLNVGYILLKENQPYTKSIQQVIENIGYKKTLSDSGYTLFEKQIHPYRSSVLFGGKDDELFIVDGLSNANEKYRTPTKNQIRLVLPVQTENSTFSLVASSDELQTEAKMYIDKKYIGEVLLNEKKEYRLPLEHQYDDLVEVIIQFSSPHDSVKLYSIEVY